MFGTSKELTRLSQRVEQLEAALASARADNARAVESAISHLTSSLGKTPDQRTEALLAAVADDLEHSLAEQIERSRRLAEAAEQLESQVSKTETATRLPRVHAQLGTVYRAETYGYVSLYSVGGRTDKVELLVGDTDPPTESVCRLNTRNDINSAGGCVIRPGEYWIATTILRPGASAIRCVFTPFH